MQGDTLREIYSIKDLSIPNLMDAINKIEEVNLKINRLLEKK